MDKESQVVPKDARVKESARQAYCDLNVLPFKKRLFDLNEQPEEDVCPSPKLYVELSFWNEDMERLREKYRFMGSSLSAKEQQQQKNPIPLEQGMGELPAKESHFKCLGVTDGNVTQMFTGDKKCASMEVNKEEKKKDDDDDHLASKKMLGAFVEQGKARASTSSEKGKEVESTSVVHHEKKKQPKKKEPKIRSIKDVEEATKDHCFFI